MDSWVILLLIGGVIGFILGALVFKSSNSQPSEQDRTTQKLLETKNAQQAEELKQLQESINGHQRELGRLTTLEEQNQKLLTERQSLVAQFNQEKSTLNTQLTEAKVKQTEAEAHLNSQVNTIQTQWKEQKDLMNTSFENLSHKILKGRMGELDTNVENLQSQQQKSIQDLLKPLKELITENNKDTESIKKQHQEETTALKTQLELFRAHSEQLNTTNDKLAEALSNSKGRGDWGELELTRLLEISGLTPGTNFETQTSEGALRPDVKVFLGNDRFIYIDAKTVLVNLERAMNAATDAEREQERLKHAKAVREELTKLSKKQYEKLSRNSMDYVILFLPRESMLRIALEEFPSLMEEAFQKNIILASPLSLLPILKNVAYVSQQATLSKNAEAIREYAVELHSRAAIFMEKFEKIGAQLERTQTTFTEAQSSFKSRLTPQLQRMETLGVKSKKTLPESMLPETSENQALETESNDLNLISTPVTTENNATPLN